MPRADRLPRLSRVSFFLAAGNLAAVVGAAVAAHADLHPRVRLSPEERAVVAWGKMRADVPNGGFAQFFYNHGGDAGVAAVADLLDVLGVPKAAAVVRDAAAVYRRHRAAFAVPNPWDGLFGSIKEFDALDRAFGRTAARADAAIEPWIRTHVGELVADEDGRPIDAGFTGTVETLHPGGVRESLAVKNGRPHGPYREFFEDGTVRDARFYKAGKRSADFWPSGQPKRKQSRRGRLTVVEWFHPNGQLQKRYVRDKDGNLVEPVRLYHDNGALAEELAVAGTEPRGRWVRFFPDGSPRLEAEHRAGGKLVVRNAWADDRTPVVTDGTGRFSEDGRTINWEYDLLFENVFRSDMELKEGVPHGEVTAYFHGRLWSVSRYERGVRHGEATVFWDNGRVRSVTQYARGKAGKEMRHPKFDRPVPAVVLATRADAELYAAWDHLPVGEYPRPLNLDAVQGELAVPDFHREVDERNRAGRRKDDYEDWNTFNDGVTYFLKVDEAGQVTAVEASGSGVYSGGVWDVYPPLLRKLRFAPGRVRGRAVSCRVLATVDHTFREADG